MNNSAIAKTYSNCILSCYTDNARKYSHYVKYHSLVYIISGELILQGKDEDISIKKDEYVFIRRDHRVKMIKQPLDEEQFKAIWFTFRRNSLREFYSKLDKSTIPKAVEGDDLSIVKMTSRPEFASLFHSLTPYLDSNIEPTEEVLNLKEQEGLYALLKMDNRFYSTLFDFTEPWKIDIMDFLNENYMYELSMEEIAEFTGRSLATFKRDFSKLSDLPPQKWLINKRLEIAYSKIKEEGKKPSDVYVEVGFKNRTHFYNAFKRQYGISPGI
jgi:AraC-like DNA-binding protein